MNNIKNLFDERTVLSLAGLETYLLFQQGFELREFCAFELLDDEAAWTEFEQRFVRPIADIAREHGHGLLLDSLVWRASRDYVTALGHPADAVPRFNRRAVRAVRDTLRRWRNDRAASEQDMPALVSADIGPRGDAYTSAAEMTPETARDYHREQIAAVAEAGADLACALTLTSPSEAIGMVRAAEEHGLPIVVSPTVETDGRLPDRTTLPDFIGQVEEATDGAPLFYMVNCAHPTHLVPMLQQAKEREHAWLRRFRGFRANASAKSHEELDNSTELDRGNPGDLGTRIADMQRDFGLRLLGGCCGTDPEHIAAIGRALDESGDRRHA